MDATQEWDENGQGYGSLEQPEQGTQPPRGHIEQCEGGGIAEGKRLSYAEMNEESGNSGPVRVLSDQSAKQQG